MSYIVLARKYRPQTFDDLVGQKAVSQTLLNALESNRMAHAYIFSGPRGVGKTTTARVLAKCLNCEKGPTMTPCNTCDSCQSIAAGNSMDDVLEIDGASNRGIEQIRELRENAKYAPSKCRYRIYIIDEAHQITKDAFGALLKTLEEPPAHVIFMMATTEVHKIPAPILSRCQRFALRPIAPDLVFAHLKSICAKEKIKIDDDAIKNIVRFVEGSLRDALSLLDQALVFSPDKITTHSLRDLLGLLPMEVVQKFARVLKEGDPATILKDITQSIQNGIDLTQLGKDLQSFYHQLILIKAGVQDPLLSPTADTKKEAAAHEFETLERNIRLLARALEEMRRSDTPRVVFEMATLKMGQKVLDPRAMIERLEALDRRPGESQDPDRKPVFQKTPQPRMPQPVKTPPPASKPVSQKKVKDLDPGFRQDDGPSQDNVVEQWPLFIEAVAKVKQSLASALEEAEVSVKANQIHLSFNKSFSQQLVDRSQATLKPVLLQQFGTPLLIQTNLVKSPASPKKETQTPAPLPQPMPAPRSPDLQRKAPLLEDVQLKDVGADIKKAVQHFPGSLKRPAQSS